MHRKIALVASNAPAAMEAACRAADQFGFYGASARLLGVFLTMDANYLSLVKPASSAD